MRSLAWMFCSAMSSAFEPPADSNLGVLPPKVWAKTDVTASTIGSILTAW